MKKKKIDISILKEIAMKQFVTQREIRLLVNELPKNKQKVVGEEIARYCASEVAKKGKSLISDRYLPTDLVFQYLADYGITARSILQKYDYEFKHSINQPIGGER